jgi:D-beta-D-heptose 7-phosphate kinase/D-beta-D-heptose 1-phosphate adenosyltransferase
MMVSPSRLRDMFRRAAQAVWWVVGDVMVDEYVEGEVARISPEAPIQIVSVREEVERMGGGANVANNLAAMGAKVFLGGVIGNDASGRFMLDACKKAGISTGALLSLPGRPTTRKTRIVAQNQHMLRLDREIVAPVPEELLEHILDSFEKAPTPAAIIISDYGKGVVQPMVVERMTRIAKKLSVPLLIDPKHVDFSRYRGATVLTPNHHELERAVGRALPTNEDIRWGAKQAMAITEARALVATLGARGVGVFQNDGAEYWAEATSKEVFDVTGAGDTAIAMLGLALGVGLDLFSATHLANAAAGVAACKVSTVVVTPPELAAALGREPHDKAMTPAQLHEAVALWKLQGKRVVFTNGCFDILHSGHVTLLKEAARQGDVLVVGLNSDASIRRLKGADRPLIPEGERRLLLAALECVDVIAVFEEDSPLDLITAIHPDVLVKGGDYRPEEVVGREILESYGGKVVIIELVPDRSTSAIALRLAANRAG